MSVHPVCICCNYPAHNLNEAGFCAYCCGPDVTESTYDDRMRVFIYMFNDLVHAINSQSRYLLGEVQAEDAQKILEIIKDAEHR